MASLPGKPDRFSAEETDLLVREVKMREHIMYGSATVPPKPAEVKQAWDEIAATVSSLCGITRSSIQCRKRYNDVRRRGKQKLAAQRAQRLRTGGVPASATESVTSAKNVAASVLSSESIEGFGGLEVGVPGPLVEDGQHSPSSKEQVVLVKVEESSPPSRVRGETSRPRKSSRREDHPFLALQQSGFDMLERELGAIRRSIRRVNTMLSRTAMLLRPLQEIADNLGRLTDAVERLGPPFATQSPPFSEYCPPQNAPAPF